MTDQYGERGPWHSGDEKPPEYGVWECDWDWNMSEYDGGIWFNAYSAIGWRNGNYSPESAKKSKTKLPKSLKLIRWRGLAKKP